MSIDGIGKKAGAVPTAPTETGKTSSVDKAKAEFRVRETTETANVQSTGAAAEVRAGTMSVNDYLDVRVHEATQHLSGMGPNDLSTLKDLLKDQLRSDPALIDLVKNATGQAPPEE
jgi:hypothetical protein